MKIIIPIIIGIFAVSAVYFLATTTPSGEFVASSDSFLVTRVIYGDTVVIQGGEHVRLLGIDTPEKGERCYSEATKRLTELVGNKNVVLESDKEDKDRYGRLLRWIFMDGDFVNERMVLEGYAHADFYGDAKYKQDITVAEQEAISNRIGCLWSIQ